MLTKIKNKINYTPIMSFSEYFKQYVISVQESNIDAEFKFLMKFNTLNIDSMQNLIQNTYEGLRDI